ncbi:MAG: glycosyltransferase, partial [Chloroflexi bacterium]|nr:glycosyltransferase [Chloroflexota bacterium]
GPDLRPHGSAYIRLLRPLTHPNLRNNLQITAGLEYEGQDIDAVIVDRLWRPDISRALAEGLVEDVRRAGAKLIYALDDNLPDLPEHLWPLASQGEIWSAKEHLWIVRFFLRQADAVWVTTPTLGERLAEFNSEILVVPNALDERLLVSGRLPPVDSPFGRRRKVIGYMGTLTHDDDLMMVAPALRAVWERHREEIEFQLVGVIGHRDTLQALEGLPVRVISPNPEEIEYPLFMLWFTSHLSWDIAISPLANTPFNNCKSDIKFLDYSAIGAAGVYSRVPAYESSVYHLETGCLVENDANAWVEAMKELLCDDHLRMQLAQNAIQYLYSKRTLAHCSHNWLKALEDMLDGAQDAQAWFGGHGV